MTAVNRPSFLAVRWILRRLLLLPARWVLGFRVVGKDRLPARRRPIVVACNHAAFVDTFYLILAVRPRFVVCGAKPRYFRTPWLRLLLAIANIARVESREQARADCLRWLGEGEMLLVYPEMGRNPDGLGELDPLAAEVALAGGVTLLPCFLYGTTTGHRGAPRLYVGAEYRPEGDPASASRRLYENLSELGAEAERLEGVR